MEDFFFANLSDDAFGETKVPKSAPKATSYNAKVCSSEWFLADGVIADGENDAGRNIGDADLMMIRKYKGDRLYLTGSYR